MLGFWYMAMVMLPVAANDGLQFRIWIPQSDLVQRSKDMPAYPAV